MTHSLQSLGISEFWETNPSQQALKTVIKRSVRLWSFHSDRENLSRRKHAWAVVSDYKPGVESSYLSCTYSLFWKVMFMALRLGEWPFLKHMPQWSRPSFNTECRECGYLSESMEHIACTCPALLHDRRLFLQAEWNNLGARTCRQAIIASLNQANTKLNIKFTKFVHRAIKLLGKDKAVIPPPAGTVTFV